MFLSAISAIILDSFLIQKTDLNRGAKLITDCFCEVFTSDVYRCYKITWNILRTDYSFITMFKVVVLILLILYGVCGSTYRTELIRYYATLLELYDLSEDLYNVSSMYHNTSIMKTYMSSASFPPKDPVNGPMLVYVSVELYALKDFDEVSGSLNLMLGFDLSWTDEIAASRSLELPDLFPLASSFEALRTILVPHGSIWTPELTLLNSVESMVTLGGDAYRQRYDLVNGTVEWKPRVHVYSACSPDITYYPFDRQQCNFTFLSWAHTNDEIQFILLQRTWKLDKYEENGEWTIVRTSVKTSNVNAHPQIDLTITIERKPLYFAFNILLPIVVLVVVNGMVFWLPVESGERVGFSVTCFLSFVVFLNIIMDILPRSSSPISYLCVYTVTMMVFSGLNTVFVILQMKLFHKPSTEKVPECLKSFIRILQCKGFKQTATCFKTKAVEPLGDDIEPSDVSSTTKIDKEAKEENGAHSEINWQKVAGILDKFFFLSFIIGQVIFSVCFLFPLGYRA